MQNVKPNNQLSLFDAIWIIGKSYGRPYQKEDLSARITALSETQKLHAMQSLIQFASIIVDAETHRIDITKNLDFLKFWLQEMGFEAHFDLEKYITNDDIVEIYDHDLVQIGRNHIFYKFCSYDPLTLATVPFHELFRRDNSINEIIFTHAKKCLDSSTKVHKIETPIHTMQEAFARNSKVFEIEHKYCSPLFKRGSHEPIAIFCTQRAKYIGDSNISGTGKIFNH